MYVVDDFRGIGEQDQFVEHGPVDAEHVGLGEFHDCGERVGSGFGLLVEVFPVESGRFRRSFENEEGWSISEL